MSRIALAVVAVAALWAYSPRRRRTRPSAEAEPVNASWRDESGTLWIAAAEAHTDGEHIGVGVRLFRNEELVAATSAVWPA